MEKHQKRNLSLGILVISGTLILILGLYLVGSKQNIFGNTIRIAANFKNVNGLMPGHNVRYAGIDIGTVEKVDILTDSNVMVVMLIDKEPSVYIRKNSMASIGTDGLMGNKLVNINSSLESAPPIMEGDILETQNPLETEEMFRTLDRTNEDIAVIVKNLRLITDKVNSSNTIWSLLMDPEVARNVKEAIVKIRITSDRTAVVTGDLSEIVAEIKAGKGTIGALIADASLERKLRQSIVNIQIISDTLAQVSGDLSVITRQVKSGRGGLGTLIMDTSFANNLNESMKYAKTGAKGFSDNMEAFKQSSLMKKYFKKQAKNK